MIDAWKFGDALCVAVRLRKNGRCPEDVDNLLGDVIQSIVDMSVRLLSRKMPSPLPREFTDADVRQDLVLYVLRKIAEKDVKTDDAHKLVNYFIKCSQRRMLTLMRNNRNRLRIGCKFVRELGTSSVIDDDKSITFFGEKILNQKQKTNTTNRS